MGKLKITQTKSLIGRRFKQRRIIEALGLGKINRSVLHDDTPTIRGMIRKTLHLVSVEKVK
ncbi:MAG: 50S ribosomal protein L30 [candidate division Zixibacteria bacterium]|nr:50S ribosomal protein L30 [candidate division Zixibacteria bacterium]